LDWLQNVELRRRVHAGLNKGMPRTPRLAPSFSTVWAKCGIAASNTNDLALLLG